MSRYTPPPSSAPSPPGNERPQPRALWAMLLTLLSGFALSQAFRTTTAMVAQGLMADFGLSPGSLGAFAGLFGLSFGVAQLLMGVGLDLYGLRRTVLTAFPLAIAGAALSAAAPGYAWLMVGQLMIGVAGAARRWVAHGVCGAGGAECPVVADDLPAGA